MASVELFDIAINDVNCSRGAPMGRIELLPSTPVKLFLRHVALGSGGYDKGGAYWGLGEPLYVAYGHDDNGEFVCLFVRASCRNQAKQMFFSADCDLFQHEISFYR